MSEKDMREILAGEYANQRERSEGSITDRTKGTVEAALRAMQEVERRTIERCAKVAELFGDEYEAQAEDAERCGNDREGARVANKTLAADLIASAIRALQDAPSDCARAAAEDTARLDWFEANVSACRDIGWLPNSGPTLRHLIDINRAPSDDTPPAKEGDHA